jgi:hypothetical protein
VGRDHGVDGRGVSEEPRGARAASTRPYREQSRALRPRHPAPAVPENPVAVRDRGALRVRGRRRGVEGPPDGGGRPRPCGLPTSTGPCSTAISRASRSSSASWSRMATAPGSG